MFEQGTMVTGSIQKDRGINSTFMVLETLKVFSLLNQTLDFLLKTIFVGWLWIKF